LAETKREKKGGQKTVILSSPKRGVQKEVRRGLEREKGEDCVFTEEFLFVERGENEDVQMMHGENGAGEAARHLTRKS